MPKRPDGSNCVDSTDCVGGVCNLGYADLDNDGFGNPALGARFCGPLPQNPTRYVTAGTDCCDSNTDVRPNQTAFFSTPVPGGCSTLQYNYDCSPGNTHEYPNTNGCSQGTCSTGTCTGSGWSGSFPGCGVTGNYQNCSSGLLICAGGGLLSACTNTVVSSRTDRCR